MEDFGGNAFAVVDDEDFDFLAVPVDADADEAVEAVDGDGVFGVVDEVEENLLDLGTTGGNGVGDGIGFGDQPDVVDLELVFFHRTDL